ncbi:MAG: cytochrome b/b6 domain-containing protein [Rhodoferax sp.]
MLFKVRVWDLPTRLFHWSLVLCFAGLLATAEMAGNAMVWHFRLGYTALSLLLFRLIWGVLGGRWSRFSAFGLAPATLRRYIRGDQTAALTVGHNPLGSVAVLALLLCTLLQAAAGLFSADETATTVGPLAKMVSATWVQVATVYHTQIGKIILIVLVQLHIAAIVFHRIRRGENLMLPMLTGDKQLAEPFEAARDDVWSRIRALGVLACCAAAVLGLVRWTR